MNKPNLLVLACDSVTGIAICVKVKDTGGPLVELRDPANGADTRKCKNQCASNRSN